MRMPKLLVVVILGVSFCEEIKHVLHQFCASHDQILGGTLCKFGDILKLKLNPSVMVGLKFKLLLRVGCSKFRSTRTCIHRTTLN
jgi:hypothetical protein